MGDQPIGLRTNLISDCCGQGAIALLEFGSIRVRHVEVVRGILQSISWYSLVAIDVDSSPGFSRATAVHLRPMFCHPDLTQDGEGCFH